MVDFIPEANFGRPTHRISKRHAHLVPGNRLYDEPAVWPTGRTTTRRARIIVLAAKNIRLSLEREAIDKTSSGEVSNAKTLFHLIIQTQDRG